MLQILSTSNETSTGPELVQNGDFSATGSNLVTNPNFTDTGSELATFSLGNISFANLDGSISTSLGGIDYRSVAIGDTNDSRPRVSFDNLTEGKSYKVVYTPSSTTGVSDFDLFQNGVRLVLNHDISLPLTTYLIAGSGYNGIDFNGTNTFTTDYTLSIKELGEGWTLGTGINISDGLANFTGSPNANINQDIGLITGKSYKIVFTISNYVSGDIDYNVGGNTRQGNIAADGTYTDYVISDSGNLVYFQSDQTLGFVGSITNITVQQLDPNGYWSLGTGWSIGDTKAVSAVTGSNSDITQSILTAGKTYQTIFEVVDYTAGTVQAVVTGDVGTDRTAIETYTESLTATGTDFSIRSKLGTFNGSVSSVSVKLLGTYDAQSIYVTAADVQTIPQASVYYLIELTSMASRNSLYFLPSSVVANNGRYTKLNFTVISKDALPQPTVGIISFYDSVGGFDTYPMGFYEFKIYEQTSSTNLDPSLATGLLEKGFAFVRDFSGNMQELTDGFKEYNPTLTQYVYSK